MGRSYIFECPRCYYRTVVVGGGDAGLHCEFQTVVCYDCKKLYDVPVKVRIPNFVQAQSVGKASNAFVGVAPESLINRLVRINESKWVDTQLVCPYFRTHKVVKWSHPGPCPRCGTIMERSLKPYRIWD